MLGLGLRISNIAAVVLNAIKKIWNSNFSLWSDNTQKWS